MKAPAFLSPILLWLGYWLPTALVWLLTRCLLRVRISGLENLPKNSPFLLICNHISHFDPPILATVIPRKVAWVVALDMYAHPAGAAFFNGIGAIPVDRQNADRKAVREMLRRMKAGQPVGLFPEGGIRSGTASLVQGAAMDEAIGGFAELAKVPVIPGIVLCTDKLYCKSAWYRRETLYYKFGPALRFEQIPPGDAGARRALFAKLAAGSIMNLAEETRRQYQLTAEDFPHTAQERWDAEAKRKNAP